MARVANAERLRQLGANAGTQYASPLDAALAQGDGRRRSVVIRDGQAYTAPHPRSAQGVAASAALGFSYQNPMSR